MSHRDDLSSPISRPSRRSFLRGAGGAALAIPFLPSLLPRAARAAAGPTPRRYVQIASNFTSSSDLLWPIPVDWSEVTPATRIDATTKSHSLADMIRATGHIAPGLRGATWEKLAPWMNLIIGANLNCDSRLHNSTAGTTMSGPNDYNAGGDRNTSNPTFPWSLDFFAERFLRQPHHAFGALRMNLGYKHGVGFIHGQYPYYCYGGLDPSNPDEALALPEMQDAAELEAKIASLSGGAQDGSAARRGKLIDAVIGDYRDTMRSPRLSSLDRARLQQAVDLWNDASNRLGAGAACGGTPIAPDGTGADRADWLTYHRYTMDTLAYALACDLTPVVAYALNHADDDWPITRAEAGELHGPAHGGESARYETMKRWRINQVAHFAERLADLTDASGAPLLDSTLMYWSHEYALPGNHFHQGYTSMLIGGAGGTLPGGRFLNVFGEPDKERNKYVDYYPDGVPLNRVGLTILAALGISAAQIESITGRVGFGEFAGKDHTIQDSRTFPREIRSVRITNDGRAKYASDAEKRKTLPILAAP